MLPPRTRRSACCGQAAHDGDCVPRRTGSDGLDRWTFRRLLEQLGLGYVVAVPKSQQIKSLAGIWRIDQLIDEAPADAWQRLSCGDGAKGPRVYDWAAAKLPANIIFDPDPSTHHRWVLARRSLSDPTELAYYLAHAPVGIEIDELARIAGSRWAVEECFVRHEAA